MTFNIYNKTTKQEEKGIHAESAELLRMIYTSVGEEIDILASFKDPEPEPRAVVQPQFQPTPTNPQPQQPGGVFTDGTNVFKYDGGLLFKKDWVEITGSALESFKLVNAKTSKPITLGDKRLFQKDWVQIGKAEPDAVV